MTTNFPNSVDAFTNPTSGDTLDNPPHDQQHADINDAMEAVQTALLDGSPLKIDDANNRVGIGTTSPNVPLTVEHNNTYGMSIASTGTYSFLNLSDATSTDYNYVGLGALGDELRISAGGSQRMTIDSSGNVGIGTTSPSYTLHVNGSARTSTLDTSNLIFDNYTNTNQSIGRLYSYATGSVAAWSSGCTSDGTRYHMRFSSPSYPGVGGIYTYNGNTYYANYSDYRLKDNVMSLANASDIVANLNPVSYTMRHNPETTHIGFLAHELQEHIPSAVGGTKDEVDNEGNPVYQNVDLTKVVPVLTAALQEALTTINDLTARIEALEAG